MKEGARESYLTSGVASVLIVEDHQMVCEGLTNLFNGEPDFEVVATANDLASGRNLARETRPDVAIVDYMLPSVNGVVVGEAIVDVSPETCLIMLTGEPTKSSFLLAMEAGFKGYVPKQSSSNNLLDAVRCVLKGGAFVPQELLVALLPHFKTNHHKLGSDLTPKEISILESLAEGKSAHEIALDQTVSIHTVRNHIQNTLTKLGAHSQLQAVVIAQSERIIPK